MIKNTYFTSHFPLISILLFSIAFAIHIEFLLIDQLKEIGVYSGMLEFFSEGGIKLTILFLLVLCFFMVFAALKLIADTINELSLLFFSKDVEGHNLNRIRSGSWVFFLCSIGSLISVSSLTLLLLLFLLGTIAYFIYFVYKVSDSLSVMGMIGLILFQSLFWCSFLFGVAYAALKLYNSFINSLPI